MNAKKWEDPLNKRLPAQDRPAVPQGGPPRLLHEPSINNLAEEERAEYEARLDEFLAGRLGDRLARVPYLFDHYGIGLPAGGLRDVESWQWIALTIRMAEDLVPGFQDAKPKGRRQIDWKEKVRFVIRHRQAAARHSSFAAYWQSLGESGESVRRKYYRYREDTDIEPLLDLFERLPHGLDRFVRILERSDNNAPP